jgi:hypothetical protein
VLIEATVKDTAGHPETRGEPVTVTASPLIVTAVPEGGTLVPGLENQVFVLTSNPDGKPAQTQIRVRAARGPDQRVSTDAGGVALFHVRAGADLRAIEVDAADTEGNHVTSSVPLEMRQGDEQILLRTERAVYAAGDRISLRVFSTRERGSAYVDVVRDGQTVLTRDLDLVNGQAELSLTATPDLAGTIDFNAYLFGRNARPVADHRLVFVQPADELKIEASADAPVHRPGEDARVRFRVTNRQGEGVQAALGLQVVDEAVFALAEKQPGFAKVFFYLEQEAMKPRYEKHSIGLPEVVQPVETARAPQHDRAVRALFAATEMVNPNRFETEVGRTLPFAKQAEYQRRYQERFQMQARDIAAQLNRDQPDFGQASAQLSTRDAWGTKIALEHVSWQPENRYLLLRSAGPDKRLSTSDDLVAYLTVTRKATGPAKVALTIEHDRGPYNGMAEIAGTAPRGSAIAIRALSTAQTRSTVTDGAGQFLFAALPPGEYEIKIGDGPETVKKVSLSARDRAVLSISAQEQTVLAAASVAPVVFRAVTGAPGGVLGGIVGGVPGGMLGGIGGGGGGNVRPMMAMAVPSARPPVKKEMAVDRDLKDRGGTAARVRSYFPEALYINPEIITDHNGMASIEIPLADSITTWRMAIVASTAHGALGSATSSLKVFQDFFVDLDLPVTLTQGDRVSIPVAAYNYSGARGDVNLQLKHEAWFSLLEDSAVRTISVDSGRVGGAEYTIEAKRIGKFKLTLAARMGGGRSDIVVREIEVVPNGREQNTVFNGRLDTSVQHQLSFPPSAIPEASNVLAPLPGAAEPGDRRHGCDPAHALRLLRADVVGHLSEHTGLGLHEADEETDARGPRQSRRLHRERVSAAAHLRSAGRRVLLVRTGAGKQDSDVLRADGILRHEQSPRRRSEADPADTAVVGLAAAAGRELEARHQFHQ